MRPLRRLGLLVFYALFGYAVYKRGGRPTHRLGTAAQGCFLADPDLDPDIREMPFFAPGRKLIATVRHANVAFDDDAAMDIRGCALRLADPDRPETSLLDLVANSGPCTFSTAIDFLRYTLASGPKPWTRRPIDQRGLRRLLLKRPRMREQYAAALRRAPESFTGVYYYTKFPMIWRLPDGKRRLVRFRIRASDCEAEQGLPTPLDLEQPWLQERAVGEQRAYDYLRKEFRDRFPLPMEADARESSDEGDPDGLLQSKQGVTYVLEVQIREVEGVMPADLPDPGVAWDEKTYPFRRLGRACFDRALDPYETEVLRFDIANHPRSLDFVECHSLSDFGSIPYVRERVYRLTQRLRKGVYRRHIRSLVRQRRIDDSHRVGPPDMSRRLMRDTTIGKLVFGWMR